MKLNEEELLLIREGGYDDPEIRDNVIRIGLGKMNDLSYDNEAIILATCSYLRRVLLEVARIKGFNVDDGAREEIPEVIPNEKLADLDMETLNDPEKLNDYLNHQFDNCNDLESIEDKCDDLCTAILPTDTYYRECGNTLTTVLNKLEEIIKTNGSCDSTYIVDYGQINLQTGEFDRQKTGEITEDLVNDLLKFVNTYVELIPRKLIDSDIISTVSAVQWKVDQTRKDQKLEDYYSDEKFMHDLNVLMEHDENSTYFYHGTQCLEDTDTIMGLGLGLSRADIYTTACEEFNVRNLLLYSRGLLGEIGRDAVVVIEVEKGENVIEDNPYRDIMPFCPSGLQGFNNRPDYYINTEHILGYVDKKNKKVVLNPNYKKYEDLKERMESTTKKM